MMKLRPIVVDETGMILAGDKRHRILIELNHKEVPDEWILQAHDLTPEQKQEFIIKDNLHAGEWDWGILNQSWNPNLLKDWELQVPEWDLSLETPGGEGDDEERSGTGGPRKARVSPGDGFAIFEMILQADQKQAWDSVLATLQNRLALEKQSDAFMVVLDTFLKHHPIGGDSASWAVLDFAQDGSKESEGTNATTDQPPLTLPDATEKEAEEPEDDDLEDLDEEDDDDDQDEDQEEEDQPEKPDQKAKQTARKSHKVVPAATKKRGRPAKAKATA